MRIAQSNFPILAFVVREAVLLLLRFFGGRLGLVGVLLGSLGLSRGLFGLSWAHLEHFWSS